MAAPKHADRGEYIAPPLSPVQVQAARLDLAREMLTLLARDAPPGEARRAIVAVVRQVEKLRGA